jgi:transcriptional regulator with GAF, ATPase, and Fis domain
MVQDAANADNQSQFVTSVLSDIGAELAVQWAALVRRTPDSGWQVVSEHGRRGVEGSQERFWAEALDREAAGAEVLNSGWTVAAFPLTSPGCDADLLVVAGRNPNAQLVDEGLAFATAFSLSLAIVDSQLNCRNQVDRLRSTLHIASRLSTAEDATPLLELIAKEAARLLQCDRSSIFLWDKERNEVEACPALGVSGEKLRVAADEGIVGETLATGRAICVDDAYADPRFNQEVDQKSGYRTRNLICVPLRDPTAGIIGAFEGINRNDGKPFTQDDVECLEELGIQAAVALRNLKEMDLLTRSHDQLSAQVRQGVSIIGDSPAIAALRDTVDRLASTDLPVLVLGESGTGKEVVAQSLHYGGSRAKSPFVAVNCAALNETLLESELFGHERGAFTDAREARQGKFELADGGTLFLDEIGDMSPGGQAKLLRVLEQKVITRVGGTQPFPVNVRIVAATNANLSEAVRDRRFREDLYYRLSVVTLDLPSLRDRPEDILPLAEFFLKQFSAQARRPNLKLSGDARRRLQSHTWPGNVRELRNLMERLAFLTQQDRVAAEDISFILSPGSDEGFNPNLEEGLEQATRQFQREFIRRSIRQVNDNMTDAARMLGLHRSNLYRKMKQLSMKEVGGQE